MWKVIPDTNENYSANDETGQIKSNDRLGPDGRKLKGKNFNISAIGRVANGRQLTSYGHLWKWADKETA